MLHFVIGLLIHMRVLGAVIISTPQDIALIDVVKGTNMFKKVNVPVSMMKDVLLKRKKY